jgi:predicted ATPase
MKLNLYIKNFKCFKEQDIALKPLTVLAGANSVGKSTTVQALLLLKAAEDTLLKKETTIALNKPFFLNLGAFKDIVYRNAEKDEIIINVKDNVDYPNIIDKPYIELSISEKNDSPNLLNIDFYSQQYEINAGVYKSKWKDFYYLNAERIGPRTSYQGGASTFIGYQGENSIFVLDNIKDKTLKKSDIRIFDNQNVETFIRQTELWLQYITSVEDSILTKVIHNVSIGFISYKENIPTNVGFGISYVLPIILNGLLAEKGSMFIVENPEAHLHPSGQSRIGQFLARVAASGVQVIVETHSEHVINGMRIAAINDVISNEDVIINFFSKKGNNEQPNVDKIGINEMGDLTKFPYGFFDQAIHDTTSIIKTRKNKKTS